MNHPILYPSSETAFETNGIGRLSDAVACAVTEERNGMFELELRYPVTGLHYSDITLRSLILAMPNPIDQPQPFRVYRITRPIDGIVTVYGEHISYDLSGIPVNPFTAASAAGAMASLKNSAAVPCPFVFWTDKTTAANMTVTTPASIRSLLGGVEGSVLDTYGGEYAFDRYLVRLYGRRGADRGVTIRYGKNLTSLEQEENCASVYTGVYPYWFSSEGNTLVTLPEKIVNAPGTYSFVRILSLDLSQEWQDPPTEQQLRARAERYMKENNIGVPKVSIDLSFVQLAQSEEYKDKALLERVSLCDTVHVIFPALGVDAEAKAVKTVYNVLLDRFDSIELGDARTNLADTIASQNQAMKEEKKERSTAIQAAVDNATKLITGNAGGYVVLHSSTGQKEPDEILIMDTPKIETAKKVWRWNKAGLGYSSNGYNGPYGLAMTQDGAIVADFITTGILTADIIQAGVLQSIDGQTFYLDLVGGVLRMKAQSLEISGKTVEAIAKGEANDAAGSALEDAKEYADQAASDAVDQQTQTDIFNKLTNNGETQGIYLKDGKLYLNATYIATGILKDVKENTTLNLSTGELTMKKGSINIGNGTFKVDTSGNLTANSAEIMGSIKTGDPDYGFYANLIDAKLVGGEDGKQSGYIDFSGSARNISTGIIRKGIQIQGGMLRISTNMITVAKSSNVGTTSTECGNGTLEYIRSIEANSDGTITWYTGHLSFINGLMTTSLE